MRLPLLSIFQNTLNVFGTVVGILGARHGRTPPGYRHNLLLILLVPHLWLTAVVEGGPVDRSAENPVTNGFLATLTEPERAWLRDHPVIRVVQDPGWPPIEFTDEHGELSGMAGDYLRLIEQRLGMKFERVQNLTWQEAYDRLKRWEIDMTTSVAVTPERAEFWAFTKPYMTIPIVIATLPEVTYVADMRELAGKKVAVVDGYAVNDWIPRDFPGIQLVRVRTAQKGLEALQRGEVFAYIDNLLVIGHYQAKMKITNIKIAGKTPYDNAQALAVRKDWAPLAGILQKALDSISETERDDIYRKWLPLRYEHGFDYTLFWEILAGFVLILLGLAAWNWKLAREIKNRKQAEEALRKSEERHRAILQTAMDGFWTVDMEGHVLEVNETYCRMSGYRAAELLTMRIADLEVNESADEVTAHNQKIRTQGEHCFETRHRRKDGSIFDVEVSVQYRPTEGQMAAFIKDITDRKQAEEKLRLLNRELRAISDCNQSLVRATDEPTLLNDICRIVCEQVGYRMAWVGYAEDDAGQSVRPVAWSGMEDGYLAVVNITWADVERGRGPVGTAIRSGKTCCIQDFTRSPEGTPWREPALIRAYHAVIALPLLDETGRAFGSLNIYSSAANAFQPEEIRLLEELAEDLAFGILGLRTRIARQQVEEDLKVAVERLDLALRAASMGVWRWEIPENRRYFDARVCQYLGLDPAAFQGTAEEFFAVVHPQDRDQIKAGLARTVAQGAPYELEYRVIWPDGSVHHVATRGHLTSNAAGEPQRINGLLWDITERKRAAEALFEAQQVFRTLVENSPDIIARYDRDCRRTYVNPAYLQVAQISPQELLATSPLQRSPLPRTSAEILQNLLRKVFDHGVTEAVDVMWPKGDHDAWYNISAFPEFDREGRVVSVMTVSRDITQRKRTEETLAKEVIQRRILIEQSRDGIVVLEQDGKVYEANKRFAEMLGYTAEEVHQLHVWDWDTQWTREQLLEKLRIDDAAGAYFETRHRCKDGTVCDVEVSTNGAVCGGQKLIFCVYRDITARKQAEEKLRQALGRAETASRAKDTFLANMSHELRTPLNGILGMTELLLASKLNAEQKDCAETVYRAGEGLLNIVSDVLDLSQIEAGRVHLESIAFELAQVINDVVALFRTKVASGQVEIVGWTDPELNGILTGDPARLRQILVNLVSNAVKFTNRGFISVSAHCLALVDHQASFLLTVQDSGKGIPPAYLPSLYERFSQADMTHTRPHGGTGLGLANVKHLVNLMGGTIEAISTLGWGTTFVIELTLPINQEGLSVEAAPSSSGMELPVMNSVGRVLLVEDNPLNQKTAKQMLVKMGVLVTTADDGQDALAAMEKEDFDLVLMDVQMPIMDGFETTRAIRTKESGTGRHIPIIAMTAFVMKGDRERCLAAGMDDFLGKPVKFDTLQDALSRWQGSRFVRPGSVNPPPNAQAAPAVQSEAAFDAKRLQQLKTLFSSSSREYLDKALHPFVVSLEAQLAQMAELVRKEEWSRLADAAHRLQGAASNVGATNLAKLSKQMVSQALLSGAEEVSRLLADVQREAVNIKVDIARLGTVTSAESSRA